MLISAATFLLSAGLILLVYWAFVVRIENQEARALRKRLNPKPPGRPKKSALTKKELAELTRKDAPLSAVKLLDSALARSGRLSNPIKQSLANSGLGINIGVVLLGCVFLATVTFLVVFVTASSAAFAAIAALSAASLPYLYIRRAETVRLKKMEEQVPQAVDMIAVSLRAGHAFSTGLLMVADELPNPLGAEFRLLYDQQNYGKPMPECLKDFATRVPLLDVRIFVTAVLTQRETGGNLAEVLDKLASVVRERFRVKRQVRVLSAHGRITGWVLGLLPPVLAFILFMIAPDHIRTLIDDPLGRQLVLGGIVLQTVGVLAIRRIVHVEV